MWVRTENGLRDHRVTFYGDRAAAMKFFGTTQVDVITRDEHTGADDAAVG